MKIFDEYGYFKSCLMINSTFKNIIRDVDNIHIFYNHKKEKKMVEHAHKAEGRNKAEVKTVESKQEK